MRTKCDPKYATRRNQRGAALVTVLFISLLLLTASAAMLTGIGGNSKNTTDVLSETKAFYASESGLQATINVLRNKVEGDGSSVNYSEAANDPDLSTWLPYNWPTSGTATRAVIGQTAASYDPTTGAAYSILVNDPDNSSGAIVYSTVGSFEQATAGTYAATREYGSGANKLIFSFNPQGSTTANHPINNGTSFGSLQVIKTGTGAAMSADLRFRIDYIMSAPRAATRTIRGSISSTNGDVTITPPTSLMGSAITLCASSLGCPALVSYSLGPIPPTDLAPQTATVFAKMSPIEPYRLKLSATGYGPNGWTKQLEAIVQRNFFNDLGSSAAIAMIGPNAQFTSTSTTSIQGGSVPSITFSDLNGLQNRSISGTPILTLPPEIAGNDVPFWQQSPAAMDAFVRQLKQAAQNVGRYYSSGVVPSTNFGDYTAGTGITFLDGNVPLSDYREGGGILVVTGNFTSSSEFRFKGLMLVLGPNGVDFSSTTTITGNLVIAPYNPNNLAAGWGTPMYTASSTTNATYFDPAFNGTWAITDFVAGVAEK